MEGQRYFDIWNGVELKGGATLAFSMEPNGYGAVLVLDRGAEPANFEAFLQKRRAMTEKPLAAYSHEWHYLAQRIVATDATPKAQTVSDGMVRIPNGMFDFNVRGIEIEGENWVGLDVQYSWEDSPRRAHNRKMQIASFDIDKFPVTNAEFKTFLNASHYSRLIITIFCVTGTMAHFRQVGRTSR